MEPKVEKSSDTIWHNATVNRERREGLNEHKSVLLWFTGLSGSGKSTLAHTVEERLHLSGCKTFVFDGDNVRHGLCKDLGFEKKDRHENIRRISEMCNLFLEAGTISLAAFISPTREDREMVKELVGDQDYIEIYCACPVEVCEERDVKGLYKKAREGKIKNFTGISAPYEPPENPDIYIDTDAMTLEESAEKVLAELANRKIIGENK